MAEFSMYNPDAPEPDQQAPVSFASLGQETPVPQVADNRAKKYDLAMGKVSPGEDVIRNHLTAGSDQALRSVLASQKDSEDAGHRLSIIQQIGALREGPVSDDEIAVIRGLKNDPQGRNPDTILEQEYSNAIINHVNTQSQMMRPVLEAAEKVDSDATFAMSDIARDVKAKQEIILKHTEDFDNKFKKSGWAAYLGNEALNLVPGYGMWSTARMPVSGGLGLSGSNMEARLQTIHLMSPDELASFYKNDVQKLYDQNPNEAMRLVHAINDYSSMDRFIDNAWAASDIAGLGAFLPEGKTAVKAAAAAGRGMTEQELMRARVGAGILRGQAVAQERAAMTAEPRAMTMEELYKASALSPHIGPTDFTPKAMTDMKIRMLLAKDTSVKEAQPGFFSIQEIQKMKDVFGTGVAGRSFEPHEIEAMGTKLQAAKAYIDVLKAASGPVPDVAKVLAGAGDIAPSALLQAAKEGVASIEGKTSIGNFAERAQSFLAPAGRLDDATSLSAEATKRLSLGLQDQAKALYGAIVDPVKIRRTPDLALIAGLKETEGKIKELYRGASDSIMDIRWNLGRAPEDVKNFARKINVGNEANVNSVSFLLGRKDGTLFESKANAEYTANLQYRLGKNAYTVEQQGGGWYINLEKTVDETSSAVRDLLVQTESTTPQSLVNIFLGHLRSSQDVTSKLSSESRSLVTHGSQAMQSVMKDVAKSIGALNKTEMKNMRRFFELDRDFHGPDQLPGRFLDTAGQFETEYRAAFGTLPSARETHAYFSYRQLNDFDYLTRNLGLYRDLSRMGVEEMRFKWLDPKKVEKGYTDYVMARQRPDVPLGSTSSPHGLMVVDAETGIRKTFRSSKMDAGQIADVRDKIKNQGYHVYEIANPLERPLRAEAGVNDYVNFVVVKDSNTRPLRWDLIPYNPGGHREYATSWFGKQANVTKLAGRVNYEGDKTLIGQYSEAETRKYVSALNKAREMLLAKDATFDAWTAANLPAEWSGKTLRQKFASKEWDINEPFHVTYTGQSVKDIDAAGLAARYGDKLHDEVNSPYNLFSQIDKKFVGARDPALKTIKENGSEVSPLFELADAPVIDPLRSLNRTVSNVVHQRLISDYKWQQAESFVQQWGHMLDIPPETLRQNPLYWLNNPKWKSTPDAVALSTAKADRAAVMSFLGMDSPDVRAVKWMQHKALSVIFDKLGQGTSDYVAEHLLSTVSDPFKYARNLAFHSKLGLFNPTQLLNQIQTLTHVTAIAGPVVAGKALAGATLMGMLRFTENPKIIAQFDKYATKMGWEEGQFTHAYGQMRRSGWNLVQGETSWRDDVADPNLIKSGWGKFLDAGTVFFKEGERVTRETAWMAAYLEHAKTGVRWDEQQLQKVLARADLMNVNMTRASQSALQQGFLGTTTQFLTYQLRLFEQLWGSRLTGAEKARVLATYSAMYGIPATTGIAVGAWPMYDSMKRSALERNQDWESSPTRALMEGLPSTMISLATGKDTNYAERFGPQGISNLSDLMKGDKAWYELITGVAGSTMKDMGQALSPVLHGLWSAVSGKSEEFPFVVEDATDAFKGITSVNTALKAVYAWNYSMYLTRSGTPIDTADKMDAVLTGLGLTRRDIVDSFRMVNSMKQAKQAQDEMQKSVVTEMRRALQAAASDDKDTSNDHMIRAQQYFAAGDFTPEQYATILKQATDGYENVVDKVKFDFFWRKAGQARRNSVLENMEQK